MVRLLLIKQNCISLTAPISSSVVVRMRKDWSPFNVEDYPKVERISAQRLPPTGHWDNQDRRDRETPVSLSMFLV